METSPPLPTTWRRRLPPPVGAELRRARRARRVTAQEVADEVGITRNYLGMLERGERAPSRVVAAELVRVLDLRGEVAEALHRSAVPDAGRSTGTAPDCGCGCRCRRCRR